MAKTTIVIPTLGLSEYLLMCLHSIFQHSGSPWEYDILVVDNGSQLLKSKFHIIISQIAQMYISKLKDSDLFTSVPIGLYPKYLGSFDNMGFPKSCNEGARVDSAKKSDFIVFLNNDCVVHPGWLDAMIKAWEAHPRTGVVGVWSNFVGGVQSVFSGRVQLLQPHYGIKCIKGVCILVSAERFWEVGGFDEEYSKMGWHTDDDLSLKMMEKKYHNVIAPVFVTHFGSKTFEAMGVDLNKDPDILADKRRFHKKWDRVLRTVEVKEKEG